VGQIPTKVARAGANPMIKSEIYAAITEKIIASLENCVSWHFKKAFLLFLVTFEFSMHIFWKLHKN
jgi:hypothetical protein